MKHEGIMTALITPLTTSGVVDQKGLEKIINYQIESGIKNIVVLGGTGEYTALNIEQKKSVIDLSSKIIDNRVNMIVGIVEPGIGNTIEIASYAKKSGASAIMVVTPYYVSTTQEGIVEYFKKLDEVLKMPIILYNIPHKTGVNLEPKTVNEIYENTKNIIGIKECTESISQMIELINLMGEKINVLAGEEPSAVASMIFGAKGAIMASANLIPDVWVKIYEDITNNKNNDVIKLNEYYKSFFKVIFQEANPGPLKYALSLKGLVSAHTSLPLLPIKKETKDDVKRILKQKEII